MVAALSAPAAGTEAAMPDAPPLDAPSPAEAMDVDAAPAAPAAPAVPPAGPAAATAAAVAFGSGGALDAGPIFVGDVAGDQAGYALAFVPVPGGDAVAIGAPSADAPQLRRACAACCPPRGAS